MSEISIEQLIQQLQNHDRAAMEILYERYSGALLRIILSIVKDRDIAEEILQDTLLKVWNAAAQYDPEKGRFFTWMVQIARNTARDHTKTKSYQRNVSLTNIDDLNQQDQEKQTAENPLVDSGLRQVVNGLTQKQSDIINAIYFEQMTQQEVSDQLNIPLGTVKTEVRKAMIALRRILGNEI